MLALPAPAKEALQQFPIVFSDEVVYAGKLGAAWAPGRVNLIGEHTDYNDGFVLPLAIDRVATFAGRARSDDVVRLWSTHFQEYVQFGLEGLPYTFELQRMDVPAWARYVLAVLAELARSGVPLCGFDAVVHGDVPLGGGMSSSAALEVATVEACVFFSTGRFAIGDAGVALKPMQVAALCQRAEHLASGVQCGILDQAASCLGSPGKAILLDCRSLEYRYLPFDIPECALVVIDTNVRRALATSAYNERRMQCEKAAQLLRDEMVRQEPGNETAQAIRALRDVTPELFDVYKDVLPGVLRRRAGYVVAENERVLRAVDLLEQGEIEGFGALFWQTHAGLRDEYEVSCSELDTLVEIAQQVPGVLGARMMGGGFGGCTINLVHVEAVEELRQAVDQAYPRCTGKQATFDICHASGGPGYGWAS